MQITFELKEHWVKELLLQLSPSVLVRIVNSLTPETRAIIKKALAND